MKFCPRCGNKNESDSKFCEKCGLDLLAEENNLKEIRENEGYDKSEKNNDGTSNLSKSKIQTMNSPQEPKEPMSKKTKIGLIVLGIVLVILFGGYKYGQQYYSRENQIDNFITAIDESKTKTVKNSLYSDDVQLKITDENTEKFVTYFKNNGDLLKQLKENLKNGEKFMGMQIQENGKKLLFFRKYKVKVDSVYGEVSTNLPDVEIQIPTQETITSDSKNFVKKVGPFLIGSYEITATGKDAEGNEMELTEDVVFSPYNDYKIDLDFEMIEMSVQSNISDAEIYLNDENVGVLKDGKAKVGPFLYKNGMTIQLKKKMEGGDIQTEKEIIDKGNYRVGDKSSPLTLNFEIENENDIKRLLDEFYSEFSNSVYASYNYDSKVFARDYFESGDESEDFKGLNDYIKWCRERSSKNQYSGVSFDVKIKKIDLLGEDQYKVDYYVEYNTLYPYSIEPENRIEGFDYIGATLKIDSENNKFKFVNMGDGGNKTFDNHPEKD